MLEIVVSSDTRPLHANPGLATHAARLSPATCRNHLRQLEFLRAVLGFRSLLWNDERTNAVNPSKSRIGPTWDRLLRRTPTRA
jgi:hypothetical protein